MGRPAAKDRGKSPRLIKPARQALWCIYGEQAPERTTATLAAAAIPLVNGDTFSPTVPHRNDGTGALLNTP